LEEDTVPQKQLLALNQILLQLVSRRLFLPLVLVWFVTVAGAGFFLLQSLTSQQQHSVRAVSQMVDHHLDQGGRILEALANVEDAQKGNNMAAFMEGTWKAYKYFDTIYLLDKDQKIIKMVPYDPIYVGMDMSSWSGFKSDGILSGITISRPFISMRTGQPTVYLNRPLASGGGSIVGELNLGILQDELIRNDETTRNNAIVILDQFGVLLAHPDGELVRQQVNLGNMEIFRNGLNKESTLLYVFMGTHYYGSTTLVNRVGWVVVDQTALRMLLKPYAMSIFVILVVTFAICLALVVNLRDQFQRNVVVPLMQLGKSTNALARGDYEAVNALVFKHEGFAELKKLSDDFSSMAAALGARQEALKESERRYHSLFEQVPVGLFRFTPDGAIIAANQAFLDMLHIPSHDILAKTGIFDICLCNPGQEQFKTVIEKSDREFLEMKIRRSDGTLIWVVIRWRAVRGADGGILYYDGSLTDVSDRKQVENALEEMAYLDVLTKLPNRAAMNKWLADELAKSRNGQTRGIFMFIDFDDLKLINDTFGHSYGDAIIILGGSRIAAEVGKDAFVARIGGDEFIVAIPGQFDRKHTGNLAKRIIKALGQEHEISGTYFHISASVGITLYPEDGDTVEELVKNADNAMYAAKRAGKNCWRFYNDAMQRGTYERIVLTNSLRYALERGELSLNYHPQVQTKTGRVIGFEALLRWNSPEHGQVAPNRFIDVAERSGMIHTIGRWVIRESCGFIRRLTDEGFPNIRVAVNVSPCQLSSDDFINSVRDILIEEGIRTEQLELEITENALMVSMEDAVGKLQELRRLGLGVSLDDFGVGYSSLTHLRNFPVNTLKIDKSFIDKVETDEVMAQIISSIIDMAHILNMTVVAEGVETADQLVFLADKDCDFIQGYLFSRPLKERDAIEFFKSNLIRTGFE
jgi:diguanylate cyclase (GGDEF)-like protein/PAS domain S-box-containing protein